MSSLAPQGLTDTRYFSFNVCYRPTKNGTEGPSYCSGPAFNEHALDPIESKLEEDWTNVEMPTELYSFWKHEWEKHGRCASILPELNSELKYFKQGLEMLNKFNIAEILKESGIVPGEKLYPSEDIYNSVYTALGKSPAVHCLHERVIIILLTSLRERIVSTLGLRVESSSSTNSYLAATWRANIHHLPGNI